MSLDNIELPSIVLQGMYKQSLIELKKEQKTEQKAVTKGFSVLGNNKRNILLMVENSDNLYLPDDQLNFLLGILAACNLTMDDVAILNITNNNGVTYLKLTDELRPEKLILFGLEPLRIGLPLDFPDYQIQRYNNQTYLTAPGLSDLQDNKTEKTKLWNCLKQIFIV